MKNFAYSPLSRYPPKMPRQARIDAPRALCRIICRRIKRKQILTDDQDRDDFGNRLVSILAETSSTCHA